MTTAPLLSREFEIDGGPKRGGSTVTLTVGAPESDPLDPEKTRRCSIDLQPWRGTWPKYGFGVDDVQACLLSLQHAAIHLYTSDLYKAGRLTWLGQTDLGLPYPETIEPISRPPAS